MLLDLSTPFTRLRATLFRLPLCPPVASEPTCPLKQPEQPLPSWVANDRIVAQYRAAWRAALERLPLALD
jgi:hypothetical protein